MNLCYNIKHILYKQQVLTLWRVKYAINVCGDNNNSITFDTDVCGSTSKKIVIVFVQ